MQTAALMPARRLFIMRRFLTGTPPARFPAHSKSLRRRSFFLPSLPRPLPTSRPQASISQLATFNDVPPLGDAPTVGKRVTAPVIGSPAASEKTHFSAPIAGRDAAGSVRRPVQAACKTKRLSSRRHVPSPSLLRPCCFAVTPQPSVVVLHRTVENCGHADPE